MFVVQRRGGYPWAEGYFNRNDNAALPLELPIDGDPRSLYVYIGDDVSDNAQQIKQVLLRLVVSGADVSNKIEVGLNRVPLSLNVRDDGWKDRQIFSPGPQSPSGGVSNWKSDPNQKLLRLDFEVTPRYCKLGTNQVTFRCAEQYSRYTTVSIKIEKLELHVHYVEA